MGREGFIEGTENTEEKHLQQNKKRDCAKIKTFKYDPIQ